MASKAAHLRQAAANARKAAEWVDKAQEEIRLANMLTSMNAMAMHKVIVDMGSIASTLDSMAIIADQFKIMPVVHTP